MADRVLFFTSSGLTSQKAPPLIMSCDVPIITSKDGDYVRHAKENIMVEKVLE